MFLSFTLVQPRVSSCPGVLNDLKVLCVLVNDIHYEISELKYVG